MFVEQTRQLENCEVHTPAVARDEQTAPGLRPTLSCVLTMPIPLNEQDWKSVFTLPLTKLKWSYHASVESLVNTMCMAGKKCALRVSGTFSPRASQSDTIPVPRCARCWHCPEQELELGLQGYAGKYPPSPSRGQFHTPGEKQVYTN